MTIRPTRHDDVPALQAVLDSDDLFPSEMLPDMLGGFLAGGEDADIGLTCETEGKAVGLFYAAPEALADGAWDMPAIAILPSEQGHGLGGAIVGHLETVLRERGQRILIADTSGTEAFALTRAFYRRQGYAEEARIRDFWAEGDDKVVFRKALA